MGNLKNSRLRFVEHHQKKYTFLLTFLTTTTMVLFTSCIFNNAREEDIPFRAFIEQISLSSRISLLFPSSTACADFDINFLPRLFNLRVPSRASNPNPNPSTLQSKMSSLIKVVLHNNAKVGNAPKQKRVLTSASVIRANSYDNHEISKAIISNYDKNCRLYSLLSPFFLSFYFIHI